LNEQLDIVWTLLRLTIETQISQLNRIKQLPFILSDKRSER